MIIAHAPLASSLKSVAQHAFPECALTLEALDVPDDMALHTLEILAQTMLARVRTPEAIIFTDVFGATPCNVAMRLAEDAKVKVITGVNIPMLWRSLCYEQEPLESVVIRAITGARQGVMQAAAASYR
jgi:mannose PTS system EIIA component